MPASSRALTRRHTRTAGLSLGLALGLAGCAEELTLGRTTPDAAATLPPVSSTRAGATVTTTVDATNSEGWLHFDFETAAEVPVPQADGGRAWDIAFQRFKVKSNGGVSGAAGVVVAVLVDRTLDQVDIAPPTGWLADRPDGPDMNPDPDTVFNQGEDTWFKYDTNTHVLEPKPRIYVVRTAADGFFALQMLRYYSDAGDAGFLQFRWKPVKAAAVTDAAASSPDDGGTGSGG